MSLPGRPQQNAPKGVTPGWRRTCSAPRPPHESWAATTDRTARTQPARDALERKFLDEADGDPDRAAHLRQAYYLRLAAKSVAARRERAAARTTDPADGGAE